MSGTNPKVIEALEYLGVDVHEKVDVKIVKQKIKDKKIEAAGPPPIDAIGKKMNEYRPLLDAEMANRKTIGPYKERGGIKLPHLANNRGGITNMYAADKASRGGIVDKKGGLIQLSSSVRKDIDNQPQDFNRANENPVV